MVNHPNRSRSNPQPDFHAIAHKAFWGFIGGQSAAALRNEVNFYLERYEMELAPDFDLGAALDTAADQDELRAAIKSAARPAQQE